MFRRVILTALCVLLVCGLTVQVQQDSANENDKKALQGKWEVVSVVQGGKEGKVPKMCVVSFDGGNLTCTPKMGDFSEFSFAIDASKTPKALDLKSKGDALVGIYELKGDHLNLCFFDGEPDTKNRPRDFASTERTTLMVLKRVKK